MRQPISVVHEGKRFRAVGSVVYPCPPNQTFHDFCVDRDQLLDRFQAEVTGRGGRRVAPQLKTTDWTAMPVSAFLTYAPRGNGSQKYAAQTKIG